MSTEKLDEHKRSYRTVVLGGRHEKTGRGTAPEYLRSLSRIAAVTARVLPDAPKWAKGGAI